MTYHVPVLLKECVDALDIAPQGVYVDATFGGGGHSREILKKLKKGKLVVFDQDPDAAKQAESIESSSFHFVEGNFRYLKRFLKLSGILKVDGILADLGISSYQIDTPEKGFSIRFDGPLDMRMDPDIKRTAADILNEEPEDKLHKIFGIYGEVKNAKTLARAIVQRRIVGDFLKVADLTEVARKLAPRGKENKYLAQVFQALRIEVNDELKALEEFLLNSAEVLKDGGRLVVISYHSLEDRLVKNFMNKGKFSGEVEKDFYGNVRKPLEQLTRKPVTPDNIEIERNPRARSARLRIAKKI